MTDVPLYVHCYSHPLMYTVPLGLVVNPCPTCVPPTLKPAQCVQVLKEATLYFSRAKPNLAMVMPAMDYIDEIFTTGLLNDRRLDPAIRAAIGLAKKTLNRYYSKTDTSDLYRIAMSTCL